LQFLHVLAAEQLSSKRDRQLRIKVNTST